MILSILSRLLYISIGLLFWNTTALAQAADEWESGKQIFDKVCQYCHTQNVGPVLTGRNLPPVFFTVIARSGLRAMPAFRPSELSDSDLEKIGIYLSESSEENL